MAKNESSQVVSTKKKNIVSAVTEPMEKAIFAARWILAPFYVGLILTLILLLIKFVQEFVKFVSIIWTADFKATELALLSMLDLALLGNLVLIIVFAGYENFVSKIESAEGSVDRPEWMGRVDFSGLKLKLIGSLVAISVIELLKDFMEADDGEVNDGLIWRIAIHMVFVISGLLFAVMDTIAARTDRMVNETREGRYLPTTKRG
jgi:uncharacterized protein (TIGR00645 family)